MVSKIILKYIFERIRITYQFSFVETQRNLLFRIFINDNNANKLFETKKEQLFEILTDWCEIEFGFRMIREIIKLLVCVIKPKPGLIILHIPFPKPKSDVLSEKSNTDISKGMKTPIFELDLGFKEEQISLPRHNQNSRLTKFADTAVVIKP